MSYPSKSDTVMTLVTVALLIVGSVWFQFCHHAVATGHDGQGFARSLLAAVKRGRLQAKDIPDDAVLRAVRNLQVSEPWGMRSAHLWDLQEALGLVEQRRLVMAKCNGLIARGLLDGCACGCRGDFTVTEKGHGFLEGEQRG